MARIERTNEKYDRAEMKRVAEEYDLDPLGDFAEFRALVRKHAFEEAALIVESEPECPGEPTQEELAAMTLAGPVVNARAAVRATKKSIAARLREIAKD